MHVPFPFRPRGKTKKHKRCRRVLEQALFLVCIQQDFFLPIAHQDNTIAAQITRQQRDTPEYITRNVFVAFNRNLEPGCFVLDRLQEVF